MESYTRTDATYIKVDTDLLHMVMVNTINGNKGEAATALFLGPGRMLEQYEQGGTLPAETRQRAKHMRKFRRLCISMEM